MRFLSHPLLVCTLFFAYIVGGVIVPVAHQHEHNCCHDSEECAQGKCGTSEPESYQCAFGHTHYRDAVEESKSDSDSQTPPVKKLPCPHEDCVACQLLYMASTPAELVVLTDVSSLEYELSVQFTAIASIGDLSFPSKRGPPCSV